MPRKALRTRHRNKDKDREDEETQYVDMVASGYDWWCPECEADNHEHHSMEEVECEYCGRIFTVNDLEHAYG